MELAEPDRADAEAHQLRGGPGADPGGQVVAGRAGRAGGGERVHARHPLARLRAEHPERAAQARRPAGSARSWRSPSGCCWRTRSAPRPPSAGSTRWACDCPWTTSAPAIPPWCCCARSRSARSRSTIPSWPGWRTTWRTTPLVVPPVRPGPLAGPARGRRGRGGPGHLGPAGRPGLRRGPGLAGRQGPARRRGHRLAGRASTPCSATSAPGDPRRLRRPPIEAPAIGLRSTGWARTYYDGRHCHLTPHCERYPGSPDALEHFRARRWRHLARLSRLELNGRRARPLRRAARRDRRRGGPRERGCRPSEVPPTSHALPMTNVFRAGRGAVPPAPGAGPARGAGARRAEDDSVSACRASWVRTDQP